MTGPSRRSAQSAGLQTSSDCPFVISQYINYIALDFEAIFELWAGHCIGKSGNTMYSMDFTESYTPNDNAPNIGPFMNIMMEE